MRRTFLGPYSQLAARRSTAAALFFQWFIVLTGATVRLTGSGLGCPNWPTCTTTRAVPELEQHAMIEFLNRMTTTPTLVAAAIALWVCWRLVEGPRRDLRVATSLVVAGIFIQAGLGALTVMLELPPEIVAIHFLVSVLLLACATFAWSAARAPGQLRLVRRAGRWKALTGAAMLTMLLLIIVAGVVTTASGPHSGASGTGQTIDRFHLFDVAIALHARGAYVFLVLIVALTIWRRQRGVALRDLGLLVLLVAAQVTLGEVQYRSGLPWEVVLAHVANAALLWVVATRIAVDAAFAPRPPQPPAPAPSQAHPLMSTP
ncbi:MAG: cytochrome oxidase assembly [Thermoleophilia bacterium]|nr:cytochrome oxidase assembly [Thermoleophilia bacterium]